MGTIFRERETEKRTMLPVIRRQIFHPIESLGRIAAHLRTPVEGSYRRASQADFALRIASNLDALGLQANPLPRRFAKLLETL